MSGSAGRSPRRREAERRLPSRLTARPRTGRARACSICASSGCRCTTRQPRAAAVGDRADRGLLRGRRPALEQSAVPGNRVGLVQERSRLAARPGPPRPALSARQGRRSHQCKRRHAGSAGDQHDGVLRQGAARLGRPVCRARRLRCARIHDGRGRPRRGGRGPAADAGCRGRSGDRRFAADATLHRNAECTEAAERVAAV